MSETNESTTTKPNADQEQDNISMSNFDITTDTFETNDKPATNIDAEVKNEETENEESATLAVQKYLSIYDILNSETSSLNEEEIKQDSLCAIVFDMMVTGVFFVLYLADIYTDVSLAVYFYMNIEPSTGIIMICIVYMSSMATAIFERRTRKKQGFIYYSSAILVFAFNLSGILLYKDILSLQIKKLRLVRKKLTIDPVINEKLIEKKRYLAFIKIIESYIEAFPQMFFQIFAMAESIHANKAITLLQYFTFATSYIGFSTTAVTFVNSVTPDKPELTFFGKFFKFSWILFMTIAKLTSLYLLAFINFSVFGFMILFSLHVTIGRHVYKDSNTNIMQENNSPLKKDTITATVFGILFTITPYLHSGSNDMYAADTMTLAHVLHFIEIVLVTIIWAWYQRQLNDIVPFMYHLFICVTIGGFFIGLLSFLLFKCLVRKNDKRKSLHCFDRTVLTSDI